MSDIADILTAAEDESIRSLDLSMFGEQDVANVILQRSNLLEPEGGCRFALSSWTQGDDEPILEIARLKGDQIVRRAIAAIWLEYQELTPAIDKLAPNRAADIGCGYAFFDLFLHRDFNSELVLIDSEATKHRHFRYRKQGAAYTSLTVAHDFLVANGCPPGKIETVNPRFIDLSRCEPVDLAVSFLACGFHFPWDVYAEFFRSGVRPGGTVILDLRGWKADEAMVGLGALGKVEPLGEVVAGKAMRVQLTRNG